MLCGKKIPMVKFYGPHAFTVNYVPTSFQSSVGQSKLVFAERINIQTSEFPHKHERIMHTVIA